MADLTPTGILDALFRLAAGVLSLLAVTTSSGPSSEGPEIVAGEFALPAGDEVVIRIAENNGTVSPEFQTGYSVEIVASRYALYVFTPQGAGDDMLEPTAERQVPVAALGVDGVQSLLQRLETLGVFDLANPDDDAPPGASVDLLEVTLDDNVWLVQNVELDDGDATTLELAQALIVATVRSSPVE